MCRYRNRNLEIDVRRSDPAHHDGWWGQLPCRCAASAERGDEPVDLRVEAARSSGMFQSLTTQWHACGPVHGRFAPPHRTDSARTANDRDQRTFAVAGSGVVYSELDPLGSGRSLMWTAQCPR